MCGDYKGMGCHDHIVKCRQTRMPDTYEEEENEGLHQELMTFSTSNNARVLAAVPSGVLPPMGLPEFASVSPLYNNSNSLCHCLPKISLAWTPPTSSAAEYAR